jgi:hypothetical protein
MSKANERDTPTWAEKLRGLFRKKRKTADHIVREVRCFETLTAMMEANLLGIDLDRMVVVLDVALHLQYMNDDSAYAHFMEQCRLYINFMLSARHEDPMEYVTRDDRINFFVTMRSRVLRDDEGEWLEEPLECIETLLVGKYEHGAVDYTNLDPADVKASARRITTSN